MVKNSFLSTHYTRSRTKERTMITMLLEVYVVLGKALINGVLTLEGYHRLLRAFQTTLERRRTDVKPVIIFTGWAGKNPGDFAEGELLRQEFDSIYRHSGIKWPGEIFAEEQARYTIENIICALAKLDEKYPQALVIRFHIVSTDYHVERLWEVDAYLPEVSDLHPLRVRGREVSMVQAPYFYAVCGEKGREWLAEGYLQMHRMSLLEVNLGGLGGNFHRAKNDRPKDIEPGTVRELRETPFQTLPRTVVVLEDLLRRVPEKSPVLKKIQQACDHIPAALNEMRALEKCLWPLINRPFDRNMVEQWIGYQGIMRNIMSPLRTEMLDPDEPSAGL